MSDATQEDAREIAQALHEEGYSWSTITDAEISHAIDTYGSSCSVAEVRNALGDLDPNQFRR